MDHVITEDIDFNVGCLYHRTPSKSRSAAVAKNRVDNTPPWAAGIEPVMSTYDYPWVASICRLCNSWFTRAVDLRAHHEANTLTRLSAFGALSVIHSTEGGMVWRRTTAGVGEHPQRPKAQHIVAHVK
ncbi:hypothetical protein J6590_091973 [Homalodisca vitripennis]|nr:hypothetical protein J6590_091973 [Homalodisca vitripennis]